MTDTCFAEVLQLIRSQIKMSLSTVVNPDTLMSDTTSTCGNDVSLED